MPPGWDERYLTVFNSTFDKVGVEGLTSMTTKLRSAGLPVETLPGPPLAAARPVAAGGHPARPRAREGGRRSACARARHRATRRRVALLFDTIRRQVNPEHGLATPTTFQWEFTDPDIPTWHLTVNNGSSSVEQGEAASAGPAPARVLPGLGGHHRRAPGPAPRGRHGPAAPARQPARAARLTKVFPRG